jgi:hypothetical protein
MRIDKLSGGVLRVMTAVGPRYIRPSFFERLELLWMFRHFEVLPQQVLSARQQRLIEKMCVQRKFVGWNDQPGMDTPILGTLERRPPMSVREADAVYKVTGNLVEMRQRSS